MTIVELLSSAALSGVVVGLVLRLYGQSIRVLTREK